ncbi:MAG: cell division protein FtsA [Candidatus Omnitrophota bacterium]|nr:cell division protein FtsA [Candidatus Omnitrophota bacterium]
MKKEQLVAGLDLGPRQFVLAAGRIQDPQRLVVQAVESVPAQGFEKEGLSDAVECADAVSRLIRQAERVLSARIGSAVVAFPPGQLKSFNATAAIPVQDPGVGINRQDVEKAISTCRSLSLDYDRQILHCFERGFAVDGQTGVKNPLGLSGKKLTVDLHLVTAPNLGVQSLTRVLTRAGLEAERLVLPGLGVAEAVLADVDRDLGVTLIRIGDSQMEVLIFDDGEVKETFLIPGGAEDIVESVSRSLKLPRVSAEHLLEQVSTVEELPEEQAAVPLRAGLGASVKTFPQGQVIHLVRAKAKDLLTRIQRRLEGNPVFRDCASGVVMTGYLSRMEGFLEMAEQTFNAPVRLGMVKEVELAEGIALRGQDTVAVGLLRHSARRRLATTRSSTHSPWLRPLETVQRLLQDYF